MLDVHALYSSGGSVSLIQPATIPANDGAVVAGVPINGSPGAARLVAWGAMAVAVANSFKQASLTSQDMSDVANTSSWLPSGTSLAAATPHFLENLPFTTGARVVKVAQKAAAGEVTFTIDHYSQFNGNTQPVKGGYWAPKRGIYSQLFGGALTAGAWGTQAFTPTYNLPNGRYAILGFKISAITIAALVRFQHADFGMCQPGCMAQDLFTLALTNTNVSGDPLLNTADLYQFVKFSEITGQPQCPVFRAGANGTGLNIWCLSPTADTPTVILNLAFLGG